MAKRFDAATARRMIFDSLDDSDDVDEFPSGEESDSDHDFQIEQEDNNSSSEPDEVSSDEESHESRPTKRRAMGNIVENQPATEPDYYNLTSGMKWSSKSPPTTVKTTTANLLRSRPGVTNAGNVQDIVESFNLFVTDEILNIVLRETNRYADHYCAEANRRDNPPQQPITWDPIDIVELRAVIGLLLLAGADKSSHVCTRDLCSPSAKPVFKSVISVNRFENILRFLRFDDRRTRAERHETDKLAAFRDIWTVFTARLPMMYRPDMDMTVDEQLVSFRGRCSFRQYIPSKPGKYGLKIFWNCDAISSYPLKGEIYLDRQQELLETETKVRN